MRRCPDRCLVFLSALLISVSACSPSNQVNPRLSEQMPPVILWAWERPEDLRFADPQTYGVAFLSQTIFLSGGSVEPKRRRQPLQVAPGSYVIAVTRIETEKEGERRPTFSEEMADKVVSLVESTIDLPDVRAIQIDFDAVVSERDFYRRLMSELRGRLRPEIPLTMTSLASWCTGDAWFNDFPVDEAVPMAFNMGADDEKIRNYLMNGTDWNEPLCRGSYGISVDDPLKAGIKPGRRIYYFKNSAWNSADIAKLDKSE